MIYTRKIFVLLILLSANANASWYFDYHFDSQKFVYSEEIKGFHSPLSIAEQLEVYKQTGSVLALMQYKSLTKYINVPVINEDTKFFEISSVTNVHQILLNNIELPIMALTSISGNTVNVTVNEDNARTFCYLKCHIKTKYLAEGQRKTNSLLFEQLPQEKFQLGLSSRACSHDLCANFKSNLVSAAIAFGGVVADGKGLHIAASESKLNQVLNSKNELVIESPQSLTENLINFHHSRLVVDLKYTEVFEESYLLAIAMVVSHQEKKILHVFDAIVHLKNNKPDLETLATQIVMLSKIWMQKEKLKKGDFND